MSDERFARIDWESWKPVDRATLLFVVRGAEILLIRKKRGLGAGKINGPGGKLEPDEPPEAGAVRETREETGLTALDLSAHGELRFQFTDGYGMHVYVFSAAACSGELQETEEALPFWVSTKAIPYDEMWQDDRLWLPRLLAGECFSGRFLFEGDQMLGHELS